MNTNRREFLKGSFWLGAAAMAAGCQLNRLGFGTGGQMQNFARRPMKRVRVGFIGIGGRGTAAVHRVSMIPGVDIVALCDRLPERVEENLAWLREQKYTGVDRIRKYVGDELPLRAHRDIRPQRLEAGQRSRLHPRQLAEREGLGRRQRRPQEDGARPGRRYQGQRRSECVMHASCFEKKATR